MNGLKQKINVMIIDHAILKKQLKCQNFEKFNEIINNILLTHNYIRRILNVTL